MMQPPRLFLALAANAFHQASLIALVPVFQVLFQVELGVIGLLVGAGLALSAMAAPVWGRMAPVCGLAAALRIILVISAVSVAVLAAAVWAVSAGTVSAIAGFSIFTAARFTYCLSAPAALPLAQSVWAGATRQSDQLLGHIGRLNAVNGIGRILGNVTIAPLMASGLGSFSVILVTLPVYLFTLFGIETGDGKTIAAGVRRPAGKRAVLKPVLPRFIAASLLQLSIGIAYILIGPILAQDQGTGAEETAGLVGGCLAIALASGIVSHLSLKTVLGKSQAVGLMLAAGTGSAALFGLGQVSGLVPIAACTALLAASVAAMLSINTTQAVIEVARDDAAGAATILSSAQFVGLALGTVLGGFFGEASLEGACLFGGGLVLISGLGMAIITFKRRQGGAATGVAVRPFHAFEKE